MDDKLRRWVYGKKRMKKLYVKRLNVKSDWWAEFDRRVLHGIIFGIILMIVLWYGVKHTSCVDVIEWGVS